MHKPLVIDATYAGRARVSLTPSKWGWTGQIYSEQLSWGAVTLLPLFALATPVLHFGCYNFGRVSLLTSNFVSLHSWQPTSEWYKWWEHSWPLHLSYSCWRKWEVWPCSSKTCSFTNKVYRWVRTHVYIHTCTHICVHIMYMCLLRWVWI